MSIDIIYKLICSVKRKNKIYQIPIAQVMLLLYIKPPLRDILKNYYSPTLYFNKIIDKIRPWD